MQNFKFQNKTEIIFGKDTEYEAIKETLKYGKKVLLHYGGGSIKKSGLHDKIFLGLRKEGVEVFELGGVKPNPRLGLVREGIKICHENGIDIILAVGGGSVIDSAKAIAAGAKYDGDVWDFFEKKAIAENALPIGVVLTIPAAGSESSTGSVITNEDGWFKKSFGGICVRPKFAIMNPELTFTLPPYQTAAGAVDMIAHIHERYFTTVKNVEFTDRLCEATIRTIVNNIPIALADPENYAARAELMWASTFAHNGFLDTGRIADWASHNIEHELSGIYDITHGAGLSIIMPAWMKYVYKVDKERFMQYANRVWDVEYDLENPDRMIFEGIYRMEQFFKRIGMPITLKEAEIECTEERLEEMAEKATIFGLIGNFKKLGAKNIVEIYKLAK
ncbi:MAG: iron-containing alcohol dehydrogenase [Fusobacteriaceae bacterium]